LIDPALEEEWEKIWNLREIVNKYIEAKRASKELGHSLDAKVIIKVTEQEYMILKKLNNECKDIFIVSQCEIQKSNKVEVIVMKAEGKKCERCWQYATDIVESPPFPNVCKRCADILSS